MGLKAFSRLFCMAAAMLVSGVALAEMRLNLKPSNTALGDAVYDLHTLVMIIITIIFIGVFGAMFYSIFNHRKSVGHQAAHFH